MSLFAGQSALSAPLDPLVSADDFAEWFSLGNGTAASLTTLEQARIQTALEITSAEIRNNRRLFSAVDNEQVYIDGSGRQTFATPKDRLPVRSISQVLEMRASTSFVTVDSTFYDWDAEGLVSLNGRGNWCWTDRRRALMVTLDHGYEELPREVAGICLSYSKRLYDSPNRSPVAREQIGDYAVEYSMRNNGLLDVEKEQLALYEMIV